MINSNFTFIFSFKYILYFTYIFYIFYHNNYIIKMLNLVVILFKSI